MAKKKQQAVEDGSGEADGKIRPGEIVLDVALREGAILGRHAIYKQLAKHGVSARSVDDITAGQSFPRRILAAAIARLASRSVPGTLVVGAGLAAKGLYERRRMKKEKAQAPSDAPEAVEEAAQ